MVWSLAFVFRIVFLLCFGAQYGFFFENGTLPLIADAPEYTTASPAELQTNLLLDNLSKIERKLNIVCMS